MSPTRHLWKPFCAKTRTAASRISRRLSSPPFDRSVNLRSIVEALQDIVVVDLTRYLPGPFAGRELLRLGARVVRPGAPPGAPARELLRLGARVVRLEAPPGDPVRDIAPEWDARLNAGKESVLWDARVDPELGRALCRRADVVLEGFRPGVAARLGVGPGDVPDSCVYC